jgi:hypothetical protein
VGDGFEGHATLTVLTSAPVIRCSDRSSRAQQPVIPSAATGHPERSNLSSRAQQPVIPSAARDLLVYPWRLFVGDGKQSVLTALSTAPERQQCLFD